MRVLLTGGSGFLGSALIDPLIGAGHEATLALRRLDNLDSRVTKGVVSGLTADQDWDALVAGQQLVIHSAARVHVMKELSADPLAEFRKTNVDGSLNLARQAAKAGVKRFIFISSIKVNGETTAPGRPFTPDDEPAPVDDYGISKLEAERGLKEIAAETGMELVIIRPVLVYGPGVKANFYNMLRCLYRGLPLPLGAVHNKRSLVALDNLVDLILTCAVHPAARDQTFLVSDGEDLSTTGLLRRMGHALGKPARLLAVPTWMLEGAASLAGRRSMSQRLCGSLQVDIQKTRQLLGWSPPVSVDDALAKTAYYFREHITK